MTCGDDDARAFAQRIPNRLAGARALFVNRREACVLTGADTPEDAARLLAEVAETVVVTLGPDGAFGMVEGEAVSVAGEPTGRVVDATGAGDLFAAAYTWADLLGAEPEARMRWANLYAALSVTAPDGRRRRGDAREARGGGRAPRACRRCRRADPHAPGCGRPHPGRGSALGDRQGSPAAARTAGWEAPPMPDHSMNYLEHDVPAELTLAEWRRNRLARSRAAACASGPSSPPAGASPTRSERRAGPGAPPCEISHPDCAGNPLSPAGRRPHPSST